MRAKLSPLSKILQFIALRPRSEYEIRQRLIAYGATADIDSILAELRSHALLNDRFFAEWFISSRVHSKPKSLYFLRQELKSKGISEDLISELLSSQIEADSLHNIILKKSRTLSREKLLLYITQRGFPYAKVQAKLDELGIS